LTHVTRIMTPGTLIFASAAPTVRPAVVQYIRPEAIGLIPDGFATASILNKFRARGFNTTSPILFLGDVRSDPCYASLEELFFN